MNRRNDRDYVSVVLGCAVAVLGLIAIALLIALIGQA